MDGSDWFDAADAEIRKLPARIIRLDQSALGGATVPDEIVQKFSSEIARATGGRAAAHVFVVTDSFFGFGRGRNDAGYRLLLACLEQGTLTRGVVYSSAPQGTPIPRVIEKVWKTEDPVVDFSRIMAFFRDACRSSNAEASGASPFRLVDLARESEHAWDSVFEGPAQMIEVDEVCDLAQPALVVIHGANDGAVGRIATRLPPEKQVVVVFVSGGGYPRERNANKSHPHFYFRRHNEVGPGLRECLRRFWTVYLEDPAGASDAFDLLEPVGLRDLVRKAKDDPKGPVPAYDEARRRAERYERAGVKVPKGLLPDVGSDQSSAAISEGLRRAADALDPPTDGIGEPPWAVEAGTLRHDYLGRIKQLTRRSHEPEDLSSFLLEALPTGDGLPAHMSLPSALEAVRGQWQLWTEERPHAVSVKCLDLYARLAADLRAAVRAFLANPQDSAAYAAVRLDASDLSEFLTGFEFAAAHSQSAMLDFWRMQAQFATDRAGRGATDV